MGLIARFQDFDHRRSERRDERFVRQNQRGVFWWLVLPQTPLLILAAVALLFAVSIDRTDRRVASQLAAEGVVVEGLVTDLDIRIKGDLVFSDRVEVTFLAENGLGWTTSLPSRISVQKGPVSLRYLRSDPTVARLVADPAPGKGRPGAVLRFSAVVLGIYMLVLLLLHRRFLARRPGET